MAVLPSYSQYWEKINNIPSPYDQNYWLDVYFLPGNSNFGWACGFNGRVIRTTDGGNSWLGASVQGADHLESIHFPSQGTGYTSGVEGIFKSTDGGASWFELNLPGGDTLTPWGTYFLTNDIGIVIGGGCARDIQHFWKTTDGGSTWNVFVGNEPNTGLTDGILYSPNGEGYAVSSGNIWHTSDGGLNWSIIESTPVSVWHEEFTRINNSFLFPYAGSMCSGGGGDGGMVFSTDGGSSWNTYRTGQRMFGAFLINTTTGWVCGDARTVMFTEDAGRTWRTINCGIEDGDLDDIWFINPNLGWAVGEGVYKYVPGYQEVDRDSLNFGRACVPGTKTDFVSFFNKDIEGHSAQARITGPDRNEFRIVSPGTNINMQSCGVVQFTIAFEPTSSGQKNATLEVEFDNGFTGKVELTGEAFLSSAAPEDTLYVINPAEAGKKVIVPVLWTADTDEEIITLITHMSGNPGFDFDSKLPVSFQNGKAETYLTFTPPDTGWFEGLYNILVEPCGKEIFIRLRIYGTSPIITSRGPDSLNTKCEYNKTDTVWIFNTGNDDLALDPVSLEDPNIGFSILGWTRPTASPPKVQPKDSIGIIIYFEPIKSGMYSTKLIIGNDDVTTIRGNKNPFEIPLYGRMDATFIEVDRDTLDLGEFCLGKSRSDFFFIRNINGIDAFADNPLVSGSDMEVVSETGSFPANIFADDSLKVTVNYIPSRRGEFLDSLTFKTAPCNEEVTVYIKGRAVIGDFEFSPTSINEQVKFGEFLTQIVTIENTGDIDLTIAEVTLNPLPAFAIFNATLPPSSFRPGESVDVEITIELTEDETLNSQICIKADSECPVEKCLPIRIQTLNKLVINPSRIDFGKYLCSPPVIPDTIYIYNESNLDIRIDNYFIDPNESEKEFAIISGPNVGDAIKPEADAQIIIHFRPQQWGDYSADLVIVANDVGQTERIPLTGSYHGTDLNITRDEIPFEALRKCDEPVFDSFDIVNNGDWADTLEIIISPEPGWDAQLDKTTIEPGETATCIITAIPSDFPYEGLMELEFKIRGKTCGKEFDIKSFIQIDLPKLDVTPIVLNFPNLWKGYSDTLSVIVENNSAWNINITEIKFAKQPSVFTHNAAVPKTMDLGDMVEFDVMFTAIDNGAHSDTLIIISESSCVDTFRIPVNANVPSEIFNVDLTIDDYVVEFGNIVDIIITLNNPVPRFFPDELNLKLEFDSDLFEPMSLKTRGKADEVPFTYDSDILSTSFGEERVNNLFAAPGNIITLTGKTLVAIPNFTEINFIEVDFADLHQGVELTTQDGSLRVTGFCEPIGRQGYLLLPDINLQIPHSTVIGNHLDIAYDSDGTQMLILKISDMLGKLIEDKSLNVATGSGELRIELSNMSSGVYQVEICTTWGKKFEGLIMKAD